MIKIKIATEDDMAYVRSCPLEGAVKNYPNLELVDQAWSGFVGDTLIGVGGVVMYWDGVAEAWLILTKDVSKCPVRAVRCIKRMIDKAVEVNKLWRVQATIRTDFPQAVKMVEKLGFHREGLMTKYLPDGTDAYMYARII